MIHISGSVAYDRIMTYPGKFEEQILPEKLHILNVSFMVDNVLERRGGTGGNIAYNLALLKEKPMLYAYVGKDFAFYASALKALEIPLDNIYIDDTTFTATCYLTTDLVSNQIAAFSPAAMTNKVNPAFYPKADPKTDWAIVSPGNLDDMLNFTLHFHENNVPTIFDPGQQIVVISDENMLTMVKSCAILIGNDYEIAKIMKALNLTKEQLLDIVPLVITTLGEKGSSIESKEYAQPYYVKPAQPDKVVDPTGCGDAYRAGLIKALHSGLEIIDAAKIATVVASFCVEQNGTQEHVFTASQFSERYLKTYNSTPLLVWE